MSERVRILVVAATSRELAAPDGWQTLRCGVGPVDAAAATAAAIAAHAPDAILHVGIAGARRGVSLPIPSLAIGTESHFCDMVKGFTWAPRVVVASPVLLAAAKLAIPTARVGVIGTSARVGGATECDVEAMEGFAVLRAAELAGIPAIEVRAISNEVEEVDRTKWKFDAAFEAITRATPKLVSTMQLTLERLRASNA